MTNLFTRLASAEETPLPSCDHFSAAGHRWRQEEIDALTLALAARRPLLVRGEAGCGKSQIARAAARLLNEGEPLVEVIHPRFEALDLLYRVDAIERLADAQLKNLDPTGVRYVKKGKLWQAIEAIQADRPVPILLIDEIDKADADVPNALLDVLGNRSFHVAPLDTIVRAVDGRLPLVVITTNEERELPAAFVRRCVVLNLNPPEDDAFAAWLVERGQAHRHLEIAPPAREHAAAQVLADRQAARVEGYPSVGLAEYIDLLTALDELTRPLEPEARPAAQLDWLQKLGAYALVKNAGQSQRRPPVPLPGAGGTA